MHDDDQLLAVSALLFSAHILYSIESMLMNGCDDYGDCESSLMMMILIVLVTMMRMMMVKLCKCDQSQGSEQYSILTIGHHTRCWLIIARK